MIVFELNCRFSLNLDDFFIIFFIESQAKVSLAPLPQCSFWRTKTTLSTAFDSTLMALVGQDHSVTVIATIGNQKLPQLLPIMRPMQLSVLPDEFAWIWQMPMVHLIAVNLRLRLHLRPTKLLLVSLLLGHFTAYSEQKNKSKKIQKSKNQKILYCFSFCKFKFKFKFYFKFQFNTEKATVDATCGECPGELRCCSSGQQSAPEPELRDCETLASKSGSGVLERCRVSLFRRDWCLLSVEKYDIDYVFIEWVGRISLHQCARLDVLRRARHRANRYRARCHHHRRRRGIIIIILSFPTYYLSTIYDL